MSKRLMAAAIILAGWSWGSRIHAEVTLGPDLNIPPYYRPGGGSCSPERGYSFSAEAPNYPSTYPKLNLRVFNEEVITEV